MLNVYDLIRKKRDGGDLTPEEISWFITGYTKGDIPDYQMAAWLMAVYFRGMVKAEIVALTKSFMETGDIIPCQELGEHTVDKHSTGGVGDKISIPLAPAVAAAGGRVPMMSGRGLGHTGGTLDKLEAIPGYQTIIDRARFRTIVREVGCSIIGQSASFVPADRKIYALRDVTATVDSIPLIASSIMSKKLAAGPQSLVLDVKTGNGAFMREQHDAEVLAQAMVEIGHGMGRSVVALLTDMNQPLGEMVGNAVEIIESIEVLHGKGPQDVVDLTGILGGWMLCLSGLVNDPLAGYQRIQEVLNNGEALNRFRAMVIAHGGDPLVVDEPDLFPKAAHVSRLRSPCAGYISSIDTYRIGQLAVDLGVGRHRIEDRVKPEVGFRFLKKCGVKVAQNETLVEVYHDTESSETILKNLQTCFAFSQTQPPRRPLVIKEIHAT